MFITGYPRSSTVRGLQKGIDINNDDAALMGRIRADDPQAFQDLLDRYWSALTAYGSTLTRNMDTARDLAQEAFTRLWEHRQRWEEGTSPNGVRNYLYRLVRNLAIDDIRKEKVRERRALMIGSERPRDPATPVQLLELEDLRNEIQRAIRTLPPRRREVFCLVHLHEMSYKQVAAVMGISAQTVANQMSTALAELRRLLRPFLD